MRRPATMLFAAAVFCGSCSGSARENATTEVVVSSTTVVLRTTTTTSVVAATTEPVEVEPVCTVIVESGDSLNRIANRVDGVDLDGLVAENRLSIDDVLLPGDELDVCVGNDFDDVTSVSRLAPEPGAVRSQQERLNELFTPYRMIPLVIDGDSGQLTRQKLCAARAALGLPVSAAHLAVDSAEAEAIRDADELGVPRGAPVWSRRWVVIDKTCQVMFTGEREQLVNIYPTSTGEPGYETRVGQSFEAFRYDPAPDTDGWHDSTNFPVAVDDPQSGNMYKPIYFNGGQAIHGATYVPPTPRSKGCARTFPLHQDELITWLGIGDVAEPMWRKSVLDLVVTVQGDFQPFD